ncbi:hypothetical protein R6Q57_006012 [Mikania cordata]
MAAIVGNTEAAEILVEKNKDFLITRALSNKHTDTYLWLLNKTTDTDKSTIFKGTTTSGVELLVNAVSSKDYHSACKIVKYYTKFRDDAVLMAIAQNFPQQPNFWEQDSFPFLYTLRFHLTLIIAFVMNTQNFFVEGDDDEGEIRFAFILLISMITSVSVLVFKKPEVEGFVCPPCITQKNSFGETPQMVFTREHKELVIKGENWMKATAESYTITAALITTIMFASAITVPGGNNQNTGILIFKYSTALTIFAISDAVSLFTSVTSLLLFLSILTTRFAEQDFLFNLPRKLIIGLTTLFISTTAMIVAFGAALFLVFGGSHPSILIPIAALTCLPIASFVRLQFPLIEDLVISTYGRNLFGKKSDEPFY